MYHNYLETIVKSKKKHIENLIEMTRNQKNHPLQTILNKNIEVPQRRFAAAIKRDGLQVIAEIKRRSPALGPIKEIQNPVDQVLRYCQGGAAAISILTDVEAFGGSLEDLAQVSKALNNLNLGLSSSDSERFVPQMGAFSGEMRGKTPCMREKRRQDASKCSEDEGVKPKVQVNSDQFLIPLLRKDFILHPLQLAEAVLVGSTAVLLIVSLLGKELNFMLQQVKALGIEALVEVHDEHELERALEAEADIIGVNHRNLKTFEIDLALSERLISKMPTSVVRVAESGIHTPDQAQLMAQLGFDAILVGEALLRSADSAKLIRQMRGIDAH